MANIGTDNKTTVQKKNVVTNIRGYFFHHNRAPETKFAVKLDRSGKHEKILKFFEKKGSILKKKNMALIQIPKLDLGMPAIPQLCLHN